MLLASWLSDFVWPARVQGLGARELEACAFGALEIMVMVKGYGSGILGLRVWFSKGQARGLH